MWFECASCNEDVPPTTEELEDFIRKASSDSKLAKEVYHRFALTRGRRKFISWMGVTFFFRNATKDQLQRMHDAIDWKM